MKTDSVLVIIPAYNEEDSLAKTIEKVKQYLPNTEVIVINDGSIDRTAEICHALKINVLSLPFNCGVGAALRTGLVYGINNKFRHMLILDADGQHPAKEARKLLLKATDQNIVLGVREFMNYDFSRIRRIAHKLLIRALSVRSNISITDPTSGFRVFSLIAAKKLFSQIESEYLADTVGILQRAKTMEIEVLEVPVSMEPRLDGVASNRGYKLAKRYILSLLVLFIGRIDS